MRRLSNTEIALESKISDHNSDLAKLIESYILNKENEKIYKDNASVENTQIKEIMHSRKLTEFATTLGVAKITEQKKETFIEDALIKFLKKNNVADDIIKTKEYVDFNALESAIYNERIPKDIVKEMSSCKEVSITTVLRINKKKGN